MESGQQTAPVVENSASPPMAASSGLAAGVSSFLQLCHGRSSAYWERRLAECLTIDDLRKLMARRVPSVVGDYFYGGAGDEISMRENEEAFRAVRFHPSYGVRCPTIDLATDVLGHRIALPVIAAPVGSLRTLWPRGEAAAAAAIGRAGTICSLSTLTGTRLEEVRGATGGPCWFQLYLVGGERVARRVIARAKACGYSALVLTIDTPVAGYRFRDQRNGSKALISGSFAGRLKFAPMMLRHLSWLTSFYADGGLMQFPNIELDSGEPMLYADIARQLQQSAVAWDDLPWIKEAWGGPIVVKGIHTFDEAKAAVAHGADAIVVSNHGGRQLDRVFPTLRVLADIAPRLKGEPVEILVDGGVRSGADVVAAVALGAKAVLIGRAYAYGLGAAGEAGVAHAFALLRDQIEHTMRHLGRSSVAELDRSCLASWPHQAFG